MSALFEQAAAVLVSAFLAQAPIMTGWLSAYDIEPTVGTFVYRLESGEIETGHEVYLATADCSRIGETGQISINGGSWLDYQVFDCLGSDAESDWMTELGFVAEVDYFTWQRHGLGMATVIPDP